MSRDPQVGDTVYMGHYRGRITQVIEPNRWSKMTYYTVELEPGTRYWCPPRLVAVGVRREDLQIQPPG